MVGIRRILVMLAAVAVLLATHVAAVPAAASPAGVSTGFALAQDPSPDLMPTDEPDPTESPSTEVPPTEIPPTQAQPTETPWPTPSPSESPTEGPSPTSPPVSPTPTEEKRVSITILPSTGSPFEPGSASLSVGLILLAVSLFVAAVAVYRPSCSRRS